MLDLTNAIRVTAEQSPDSQLTGKSCYLVMELAVDWLALRIDQLEGVGAITVHVAIAIRNATVAEQEGHLSRGKEVGKTAIKGAYEQTKPANATWWRDSGRRLQKSHTMSGSFRWV